jgi:hypothetical protein
MVRKKNNK